MFRSTGKYAWTGGMPLRFKVGVTGTPQSIASQSESLLTGIWRLREQSHRTKLLTGRIWLSLSLIIELTSWTPCWCLMLCSEWRRPPPTHTHTHTHTYTLGLLSEHQNTFLTKQWNHSFIASWKINTQSDVCGRFRRWNAWPQFSSLRGNFS